MKKTLPIANGIALVFTIIMNYLSNAGIFNGNTMGSVSDRYFNYFTPAGWAFSIWGLIYLGLLGFAFYTGRTLFNKQEPDPVVSKIGWWFVISCIANSLWVVTWLYDYTGLSVLVMALIFISLLKIILNTRMELDAHPFKRYAFIFWPFALYFGWISVAWIANIAAYLTKIGWNGFGVSEVTWTIIMICIAGIVNVLVVVTRNLREYASVGIWALIAIAASNGNREEATAIVYSCYIVAAIIFITILINGGRSRHRSIDQM